MAGRSGGWNETARPYSLTQTGENLQIGVHGPVHFTLLLLHALVEV